MRDMKEVRMIRMTKEGGVPMTTDEVKTMMFRRETRCKKQKHAPVTNTFGVTWCKDCGTLIQKF
jgi:hypothetical protein